MVIANDDYSQYDIFLKITLCCLLQYMLRIVVDGCVCVCVGGGGGL